MYLPKRIGNNFKNYEFFRYSTCICKKLDALISRSFQGRHLFPPAGIELLVCSILHARAYFYFALKQIELHSFFSKSKIKGGSIKPFNFIVGVLAKHLCKRLKEGGS